MKSKPTILMAFPFTTFCELLRYICVCCCGLVTKSCLSLETPWTVARQAPLSMGFPSQENWSGLSCPPPGDLTNAKFNPWAGK